MVTRFQPEFLHSDLRYKWKKSVNKAYFSRLTTIKEPKYHCDLKNDKHQREQI